MYFNKSYPMHLQVANFICRKILLKEWKEGVVIPSAREVAISLEVNPASAEKAFEHLKTRNILGTDHGSTMLTGQAQQQAMQLLKEDFLHSDLPALLEKMKLMNMSISELTEQMKKAAG